VTVAFAMRACNALARRGLSDRLVPIVTLVVSLVRLSVFGVVLGVLMLVAEINKEGLEVLEHSVGDLNIIVRHFPVVEERVVVFS